MNYNHSLTGFLLRFEIARTTLEIAGTKNSGGTTILARNARSGLVREGPTPPPLVGYGGPSSKHILILRAQGCILGYFWPIWLSVLALLREAFAA